MSRKSYKSEDTRYNICRAFGTRSKTELITESLENKANAPLYLTTRTEYGIICLGRLRRS